MKLFSIAFVALLTLSFVLHAADTVSPVTKPNVIIILADDLGVECLSVYGGISHKTPNIDRLAAQSMRFNNCFSNPFCSPSRASLLTGRYPFKNGLTTVLDTREKEELYLHPDQPSFVRQLQQKNYATQLVGKWHVSLEHRHDTINQFGVDQYQVWRIFDEKGEKTTRFWTPYQVRNGTRILEQNQNRYGPDLDLEYQLEFIKANAAKKQPFLAYYSTCLPHFPWEPTPDSADQSYRQQKIGGKGDAKYFPDMVSYLDKQIGKFMQVVEDLGIADNTIIIFLADNGTDRDLVNLWGDGKKLRGGKGTMTDRGTLVPLIVRWPGRIKAGTTCDDLIDFSDFCPTICELTGSSLPPEEIHGKSFASALMGKSSSLREWVHIQHEKERQIRNKEYMLNNKGELRRVVELWQNPAPPNENKDPEKEAAARKILQAAFEALGN
jgi:arylsulfatase A